MSEILKIHNYVDEEDEIFINIKHVASIKKRNYDNTYWIVMDNGYKYNTDKDTFDKIMKLMGFANGEKNTCESEEKTTEVKSDKGYVACACGQKMYFKKLKAHDIITLCCLNCKSQMNYAY